MSRPPYPRPTTPTDRLVSAILHPSRWIPALIVLAYLAGFSGVLLSVVGNPANPHSPVGVAGIALMGIAFVALFVVSFSMVKFADGDDAN